MKWTAFVPLLLPLVVENGVAFSPKSFSKKHVVRRNRIPATGTPTELHSKGYVVDDSYDYDELMNDDLERNRMANNYVQYGHESWLRHRSGDRFYRNLVKLDNSPIVQSLLDEVALLAAIAFGIILWNELLIEGYTDFSGLHHDAIFSDVGLLPHFKLSLPIEPFLLCSGPLGLLLVFRNDASFDRYRNAFHQWEKIVSNFNNMLLMASNAAPLHVEETRQMGTAAWALCRTLQHRISGRLDPKEKYEQDIRDRVPNKEQADRLVNAKNKILLAQYDIHQTFEPFTEEITVLDKRALITTVNDVANACIECERIFTTPIPLLYTRHTLKFLTFWMCLLPFALYDIFSDSWNHILMIPAMAVLTFLFFGIEEIAVNLEEPFSILPLDELVEDVWDSTEDVTEWMMQQKKKEEDPSDSLNGEIAEKREHVASESK